MIDEKKLIEDFMNNYLVKNDGTWNDAMDRAVELTKTAPKVGEWIPCSDRLPEPDKAVLVYTYDDFRVWSLTRKMLWEDEDGYWQDLEDVVAWQPLPEPYKEGKQ